MPTLAAEHESNYGIVDSYKFCSSFRFLESARIYSSVTTTLICSRDSNSALQYFIAQDSTIGFDHPETIKFLQL